MKDPLNYLKRPGCKFEQHYRTGTYCPGCDEYEHKHRHHECLGCGARFISVSSDLIKAMLGDPHAMESEQ